MGNVIDEIKQNVIEQFDSMASEFDCDFDDKLEEISGTRLKEEFLKKLDKLRKYYESDEIDPYFDLNLDIDDDNEPVDSKVKVAFFAFSGNPPHWGHIMAAFDALVDYKLDKVIFVSNGDDPRKPNMLSVDKRYSMIEDIVDLFYPFFEFSEIAREPYFDEDVPMIGECTLFRFFKINPDSEIVAYYFAGSDHLNRYVVRDGEKQLDTVGHLEKYRDDELFGYDKDVHEVVGLFNARDEEEFDSNLKDIDNPEIDIVRLDPTISFSSTQIRNALKGEGDKYALMLLPYVNYTKIKEEGWYSK